MNGGAPSRAPGRVLLRDAQRGRWLAFSRPRAFVNATRLDEVVPGLRRVETAVEQEGLYAAGFVAYEAAPAFDPSLRVRPQNDFPLLWFGLYEQVEEVELPPAPAGFSATWEASVSREAYFAALARIKTLIRSGDTYQVNYTFRLESATAANSARAGEPTATAAVADPWGVFLQLAAAQQSPFSAFIEAGDWVICSASPELFFRLEGERVESRPMKGTAARGLTAAQDRAQAAALRASEKDRAENVMIVDMVRHDLGRIARPGSVQVSSLCALEKYPTVWQLTSTVEARTDASLSEVFGALFPAASITGAPKVHTMELIAELEQSPRRLYTGAIGFVLPGRRAQFNVAIRTLLLHRPSGRAEYGVGGGIVWDSEPEPEWRECAAKARILAPPPPPFSLLEALLWTPEGGYWLLQRHLERLEASADFFGFRWNLKAGQHELKELATRLAAHPPAARVKVRLLLDKDGRLCSQAEPLPPPSDKPLRVGLAAVPVNSSDLFLYHKTTHRAVYEAAAASCPGCDAVLLYNERGEITEFTRANVAIELNGQLVTPPVSCGLLAGTLRAELLALGELREQAFTVEELKRSPRVVFLNSVRGTCPVVMETGDAD